MDNIIPEQPSSSFGFDSDLTRDGGNPFVEETLVDDDMGPF